MRHHSEPLNATIFRTRLGWMTIFGRAETLTRLHFGATSQREARRRAEEEMGGDLCFTDWNPELVMRLQRYAAGEGDDFRDVKVDTTGLTQFSRKVLTRCRKIPAGETTTYGQLAEKVGSPGAARAVGSVMSRNRIPIVIPCHRVVGSNGKLTGFTAPGGCDMKRRMLELEASCCELAEA